MFCLTKKLQQAINSTSFHESLLRFTKPFRYSAFPQNSSYKYLKKMTTRRSLCSQVNLSEDREHAQVENYGQPTPESHPYLLLPGELVPGTSLNEFIERRNRLVEAIILAKPGCCHNIVIPSSEVLYMTEKIPYIYRQNSDFRYLTGCLEPESVLLISINQSNAKTMLFVRENNKHSELWEGPRTGVNRAAEMFGIDEGHPISCFPAIFKSLSRRKEAPLVLWYDVFKPVNQNIHKTIISNLTDGGISDLETPRNLIHQLRLIKSKTEQELMKKSADIASKAIAKSMEVTKCGITEHQLFATVDYQCRVEGAEHLAYPPVVATGNNATVIHYINNNQMCKDGEIVLMDAGCELHGYCSDITRAWPVNGKFTDAQRTLYEIVLSVQLDLINKTWELSSLDELFQLMCNLLGRRLSEAHVLSKSANEEKLDKIAFKLCPHHVSHYLGMDVHDTSTVGRSLKLKEGMVFTVEPGIYVNYNCQLTKPEFRGCGIRIEDDILITNSGPEVLSSCPKQVCDIEKLINSENT